eukprot:Nk52_evm16s2284 gene=Nk52_evmTU16s2284
MWMGFLKDKHEQCIGFICVGFARWAALGTGLVYGFLRNSRLNSLEASRVKKQERIDLQKKAEEKRMAAAISKSGIISDPDHPQFDMEKYLMHVAATSK